MAYQIRGFVVQLVANVNVYRLAVLGLALMAVIAPLGMPGGGGGTGGV
jgi:hypothetical protein